MDHGRVRVYIARRYSTAKNQTRFYTHDEIDRVARLMSVLMSLHQQGFTRLQLSVTSVGVKTHEPFDLIAYPNVFAWTHKDLLWDDWNSRHVNGDRKVKKWTCKV